jgi:hypothetical protein
MPLTIDTLGQSLPTEVGPTINQLSPIFPEECRVSVLDDPDPKTWQVKVQSKHHTRMVNLDDAHQTVQDIQVALRKIQDSFGDHCHDCPRTDYLLKCQGNKTKTCKDWVCPDHNEGTRVQPGCHGCYIMPFGVSLGILGAQP